MIFKNRIFLCFCHNTETVHLFARVYDPTINRLPPTFPMRIFIEGRGNQCQYSLDLASAYAWHFILHANCTLECNVELAHQLTVVLPEKTISLFNFLWHTTMLHFARRWSTSKYFYHCVSLNTPY